MMLKLPSVTLDVYQHHYLWPPDIACFLHYPIANWFLSQDFA